MAKLPQVTDTGRELVVTGVAGAPVSINNKETLEELRRLLAERKEIGLAITESLKSHGINIAGEEETVVSPPK